MNKKEYFPDGTLISEWFYETDTPTLETLGKQYVLTDFGVFDDGNIYTDKIQSVIDLAATSGGGVIVVPKGTYRTGALFFKQGVHLYIAKDGILFGSDDVSDYPVCDTRIEGESCKYFPALINADNVDGFTMCGEGTIDGNGHRAWKAFWIRRKWNPGCTGKDEQRARLVYISNSKNVLISGLTLQNSQFWTNHIYKCQWVKFLGCKILSPKTPVAAPSTDAIDIDASEDVLVKNCYLEVNDDAVALKGGKGPYADIQPENGKNERILIEDCECGFCHSCLTGGSESIHSKNVIFRRAKVDSAILFRLKMRPDTPQIYEYITVEDVKGSLKYFIDINPWGQYFDLKDRPDAPMSYGDNITVRNCECECDTYFNVKVDESQYLLSNFNLENLKIIAQHDGFSDDAVSNAQIQNVEITLKDNVN